MPLEHFRIGARGMVQVRGSGRFRVFKLAFGFGFGLGVNELGVSGYPGLR